MFAHDGRTDEAFKAASTLTDNLNNPALTSSALPQDSAFSIFFDVDGSLFDYFTGVGSCHYFRRVSNQSWNGLDSRPQNKSNGESGLGTA